MRPSLLTALLACALLATLAVFLARGPGASFAKASADKPSPPAPSALFPSAPSPPAPSPFPSSTSPAPPASAVTTPTPAPLALTYAAPVLPQDDTPGVLGHWQGRLLTPLSARAPAPDEDFHLPVRFEFPLDAARRVTVLVHRYDVRGPTAGVFTGEVAEAPGSSVVLAFRGLAQAGLVHLPALGRSYVVQGDEHGNLRITENDLARAPGCTAPLAPLRPPAAPL